MFPALEEILLFSLLNPGVCLCVCVHLTEGGIAERQQSIFGCIVCFANLSTCCMPFLTPL